MMSKWAYFIGIKTHNPVNPSAGETMKLSAFKTLPEVW
jgi:hypothetical protein